MPSADAALMEHASMTEIAHDTNTRQHGRPDALSRAKKETHREKEAAVYTSNDEAVAPKRKTQSFDYVWRSAVAGGMAGCAVSSCCAAIVAHCPLTI